MAGLDCDYESPELTTALPRYSVANNGLAGFGVILFGVKSGATQNLCPFSH